MSVAVVTAGGVIHYCKLTALSNNKKVWIELFQCCFSGSFIVNFEHVSHIVLCSNYQDLYDEQFCENNSF